MISIYFSIMFILKVSRATNFLLALAVASHSAAVQLQTRGSTSTLGLWINIAIKPPFQCLTANIQDASGSCAQAIFEQHVRNDPKRPKPIVQSPRLVALLYSWPEPMQSMHLKSHEWCHDAVIAVSLPSGRSTFSKTGLSNLSILWKESCTWKESYAALHLLHLPRVDKRYVAGACVQELIMYLARRSRGQQGTGFTKCTVVVFIYVLHHSA